MIFFNFDSYVILVGLHTILVIPVSKTTRYPHPHLHSSEFKREGHPCQRIYIYIYLFIVFFVETSFVYLRQLLYVMYCMM